MKNFFGVLAAFVILLAPVRGEAQTVASDINAYRDLTVTFSGNADECNLDDSEVFKQKMRDALASAGIRQSDASRVNVNLGVSANGFGLLNTNCVFSTKFDFLVKLDADKIATEDPAARNAFNRLGAVDVVIYSNGFFATQQQKQPFDGGRSVAVRDRVIDMIGMSVNKLVEDRAP